MPDEYADLRNHFDKVDGVTVSSGRGAQGVKIGKKMFAMFYKGHLLLRLPAARVEELIASGEGLPFDPGTRTPMKDRVLITETHKGRWIDLCEESWRHAESGR